MIFMATKRHKKAQKNSPTRHPERSEGSSRMIAGVHGSGFFTSFRMTVSGTASVYFVCSVVGNFL
jgi:hypothetical protein